MLIKTYCLVSIDYWRYRDAIIERHKFYASTPEERESLFGAVNVQASEPRVEARALGTR